MRHNHIIGFGKSGKGFMVKITLLFISAFCFLLVSVHATEVKVDGNILQNWIRLSLIGKDQAEIELFFKDVEPKKIEKVKNRLRIYVMRRLRSKNVKRMLRKASQVNDIGVVIDSIREETRYFGLEDDDILKYNIKEEFGINPFWWNRIEKI